MKFLLDHDVPDDLRYLLERLGHGVLRLREVLSPSSPDEEVLRFSCESECVLVTCNRDDYIALAQNRAHAGIVIVVRRRTRAAERAALVRLLERAGEAGIRHNINFA